MCTQIVHYQTHCFSWLEDARAQCKWPNMDILCLWYILSAQSACDINTHHGYSPYLDLVLTDVRNEISTEAWPNARCTIANSHLRPV
jgi:hypothetical protein